MLQTIENWLIYFFAEKCQRFFLSNLDNKPKREKNETTLLLKMRVILCWLDKRFDPRALFKKPFSFVKISIVQFAN